jgi:diacylglycerol kinase
MISFRTLLKSINFAFTGLVYVIKSQNNARIHLLSTILVIVLGVWLELSLNQWAAIFAAIAIVWITECFNTSFEKIFDLVNPEPHPLVKHGKDAGAAAVLIAALLSVIIGVIIMGPPLLTRIRALIG